MKKIFKTLDEMTAPTVLINFARVFSTYKNFVSALKNEINAGKNKWLIQDYKNFLHATKKFREYRYITLGTLKCNSLRKLYENKDSFLI